MNKKKLIAVGEAAPARSHLTKPCTDCPLRRDSLQGWLGGYTAEEYSRLNHSDETVDCHVHAGSRCAGVYIYRRNTAKWVPEQHKLPADHTNVFSTPMEFIAHHSTHMPVKGLARKTCSTT
jgi:hypothetical protein